MGLHEAADLLSAILESAYPFHQAAADALDGAIITALSTGDCALLVAEFVYGLVNAPDDVVLLTGRKVAEQCAVLDIACVAYRTSDPGRVAHAGIVIQLVHHKHPFG